MSSGKIRVPGRRRGFRRRGGRPHPPARPAGEIHHRRSARHDRGGRRPPHASIRSRARPSDLDRLWRLRRPEPGGANPRGQGPAARSRPRRLRSGRDALARPSAAEPWPRRSTRSGARTRATPISSPRTSPRQSQSLRNRDKALAELHPSTDAQKQALASAIATVDSDRPVAIADVVCAVEPGFLSAASDGGRVGDVSVLRLRPDVERQCDVDRGGVVGAIAVASAVYLILDLSDPYSGAFRTSSAPLEQVLAVMGKE